MATILYLGEDNPFSTSAHRAQALHRLGHKLTVLNPAQALQGVLASHWLNPIHYRTGYRLLQSQVLKWLHQTLEKQPAPDLVWVNGGELLGPRCLQALRLLGCPLVLYNNDDPTGGRDGRRFDMLLQAIPFYDLCVVRRRENITEYKNIGARCVKLVHMSYDEEAHKPFASSAEIPEAFRSEVAFIGTWMRHEKRDFFLLELLQQGIPLSIWGGRWQKSAYWNQLQPVYRGDALGGREYVAALQGAKICLGLLSKGNRDLHTRRSVEVPYAGGLLCAERTSEHLAMYREGVEAVFWDDARECAATCHSLLANAKKRNMIRVAGMRRVRAMGVGNEQICRSVLDALQGVQAHEESHFQAVPL